MKGVSTWVSTVNTRSWIPAAFSARLSSAGPAKQSIDTVNRKIIAKVPYPNYTEKRVKAKMEKFPLWYTSQTLTKILQGFGRSIRSEDDWARTYVLDSAVNNVFFKGQGMIPRAYYDVLGIDDG